MDHTKNQSDDKSSGSKRKWPDRSGSYTSESKKKKRSSSSSRSEEKSQHTLDKYMRPQDNKEERKSNSRSHEHDEDPSPHKKSQSHGKYSSQGKSSHRESSSRGKSSAHGESSRGKSSSNKPMFTLPQDKYHEKDENDDFSSQGQSSLHGYPSSYESGVKKSPHKNVKKSPEQLLEEYGRFLHKKQRDDKYQKILQQHWAEDTANDFEFFFGSNGPFSQHFICYFEVDGKNFCCAEQYMMYMKAVVFNDKFHAHKILNETDPRAMKKLGRQVQNFDPKVWGRKSLEIVKKGNKCKFSQNEGLKAVLYSTFPRIMVEASPRDRVWGIGLGRDRSQAWSRATWKGTNKLGYILTAVRNELMREDNLLEKD